MWPWETFCCSQLLYLLSWLWNILTPGGDSCFAIDLPPGRWQLWCCLGQDLSSRSLCPCQDYHISHHLFFSDMHNLFILWDCRCDTGRERRKLRYSWTEPQLDSITRCRKGRVQCHSKGWVWVSSSMLKPVNEKTAVRNLVEYTFLWSRDNTWLASFS